VNCILNEEVYCNTLRHIMLQGEYRDDRTGVGTYAVFGVNMEFNLTQSFPILTKKKMPIKAMASELLWMLRGETHIKYLKDNNVKIWDEWADSNDEVGKVYGYQWRNWGGLGIDQIQIVINAIKTSPRSRRHIVSAWNVADLPEMNLPPCPCFFQFYVTNDGYLDMQMYQRSGDMFLGVPFDICTYSMLTHMVAQQTGLKPGRLLITIGDCHIYSNHKQQVIEYLNRAYTTDKLPQFDLNFKDNIDDYRFEDFKLTNYESQNAIKAEVAV
jgi:thymidylate synthase